MNKPKEKQNLQIVLKQIDAFNARDIEGCLKYWTDDLKVIDMPDEKVIFSNKEEGKRCMSPTPEPDGRASPPIFASFAVAPSA